MRNPSKPLLILAAAVLASCASNEAQLRKLLYQKVGLVQLPGGTIEVSAEIRLPEGARDLDIVGGAGTVLRASDTFQGRAILSCQGCQRVRLRGFAIDGNRAARPAPFEMAPPENAFRIYYGDNGVLIDQAEGFEISEVRFYQVRNFAVLASRSSGVKIDRIEVESSGSRNKLGRNNSTGGVVIEEGSSGFAVTRSVFRQILGNAVWTHSLYTSPRNRDGRIEENRFEEIGRDAIQVGHATEVIVRSNSGKRIGYPPAVVDVETGGTPVAIDTAGNVDRSLYANNRFEEINGKCFDLDGFHHGELRANTCINQGRPEDYEFGHFALVMNNNNPDMRSEAIAILDNEFSGTKFGGLYIMGSGHRIVGNRLLNLNTAHCNDQAARFGCLYKAGEPDLLRSGIYLGRGVKRLETTQGNVIEGNRITGYGMTRHCIVAAPQVLLGRNHVSGNQCLDEKP